MPHWFEPITLALHRQSDGHVFRYLTPTQTGLELVFECETCSGEGELEHRKPVGRIDEASWMDGCSDCEDGEREFVECNDCGTELFRADVGCVVRHEPRIYYYALCKACSAACVKARDEYDPTPWEVSSEDNGPRDAAHRMEQARRMK
jgi:hypothetical protein